MSYEVVSGPFKKLRSCQSFPEAKARMLAGVSPTRCAIYMQECGDFLHLSKHDLVACLCSYRRSLSAAELLVTRDPGFVAGAKQQVSDTIDELEELAAIYNVQKERILQGRKLEVTIGVLNRSLGNEVRIAGEILRTSATIKEQVGLGGVSPTDVSPVFRYDVRSRYGERVARVIEDPAKRNKVLDAVSALLDAGAAKTKQAS